MNNYLLEKDKQLIKETEHYLKSVLGSWDITNAINDVSEKFDRRKFGRLQCNFCDHTFNPFYLKELYVMNDWEYKWRGSDFKEPEKDYSCNCPNCKERLYFSIYISQ